jgi:hypothetical protein
MKQSNLFPKYAEFINEASSLPRFKKSKSGYGTIQYSFTLDVVNGLGLFDVELYSCKGEDWNREPGDHEMDLVPNKTYVVCNFPDEYTYIFKVEDWYKINDFLVKVINEDVSVAKFKISNSDLEINTTNARTGKPSKMKFEVDEMFADEDEEATSILWTIDYEKNNEIMFVLSDEQIRELSKLKFNK